MAKGIYIGVLTDVPIMETTTTQVALSLANLSNFFDVSGETGTRSWTRSDATDGGLKLVPGNFGVDNSTAEITLTAKKTLTNVVIKGAYYTEQKYDQITLTVAGSVKLNAVSGSSNPTNRWTGTLQTGQTIVLRYAKDSSKSEYGERNTYFQVTCDPVTTTSEEIVGYKQQELARRVKSLYVSINGIARKVQKAYIGVEGVARKVFGEQKQSITITGNGNASYCYITINDQKYESAATVQVDSGTVVTLYVRQSGALFGSIWIDNILYASTNYQTQSRTYNLTVTENISIALEYTTNQYNGGATIRVTHL